MVPDMLRRSPLASLLPAVSLDGEYPAKRPLSAGLMLAERAPHQMLLLSAYEPTDISGAFSAAAGHAAPDQGQARTEGEITWLWQGPGRLLRVAHCQADTMDLPESQRRFGASHAVVDLSHARTIVRLSGAAARHTLAKGCSLDMRLQAFGAGCVALTTLARIPVVLHALGEHDLDIYWSRSYAQAGVEWLIEAGSEAGLTGLCATAELVPERALNRPGFRRLP